MYYAGVVKNISRAERTSDCKLHLVSVSQVLNLFPGAGHRNYAESARLMELMMMELMMELPVKHSPLFMSNSVLVVPTPSQGVIGSGPRYQQT
jgi:hypothetical protein